MVLPISIFGWGDDSVQPLMRTHASLLSLIGNERISRTGSFGHLKPD